MMIIINESAVEFLTNLGHGIAAISSDNNERQFLYQRLSIALQLFNAILPHESFVSDADLDNSHSAILFYIFVAFNPHDGSLLRRGADENVSDRELMMVRDLRARLNQVSVSDSISERS